MGTRTEDLEIAVEEVAIWHPDLAVDNWIGACVALLEEVGAPPWEMMVECRDLPAFAPEARMERLLRFQGNPTTFDHARRLRATYPKESLTEEAALCVAAIVLPMLAGVSGLETTQRGERADYQIEQGRYVLEISGTRQRRYLASRHHEKIVQGLANPARCDVYVVVACFDPAYLHTILSYHRQGETNE